MTDTILTSMQKHLMSHVANGETNIEIADALGICRQTVEARIRLLLHKTNSRNRAQLVMRVYGQ